MAAVVAHVAAGVARIRDAARSERAASNFGVLKAWADYGERLGVVEVLAEIHAGRQWEDLGYGSFREACAAIIGRVPLLDRAERREAVADLTEQGMSTRDIAGALGVSQSTVVNDQRGEQNCSPVVTGADGKTYPRSPITPEMRDAADEIMGDLRPEDLTEADPFAGWTQTERDALAEFQATGRSIVVNMATGAVCGPRLWSWAEQNDSLQLRDWGVFELLRKHGRDVDLTSALHLGPASALMVGNLANHRTSWLVISVLNIRGAEQLAFADEAVAS